jgi:glycosyltransferase involved in cell wall biosynthesis
MKLISIVVPVYNSEKYLEKCLVSLINQTYKNIEIIVINDGSTDGSLDIAKQLAKRDSRVKVYSKKNGGLSSARNHGIEKASGEYIGFVDSDDYIDCNMYSYLYDALEKNIHKFLFVDGI